MGSTHYLHFRQKHHNDLTIISLWFTVLANFITKSFKKALFQS